MKHYVVSSKSKSALFCFLTIFYLCRLLRQPGSGCQNNTFGYLLGHTQERRVRAVHRVRDVTCRELRSHGLLCCDRNSLVLQRKEEANLDAIVPGLVGVVVGEDTGRLRLERRNCLFDKRLIGDICVKDLAGVAGSDEVAL